jgi:hypothetical protein
MRSCSRLGLPVLAAAALSNVARADFTFPNFTGAPVNPVANSSVLANGDLQLTPVATFMIGDAWHAVAQRLDTGFSTSFRYSIDGGSGADGLAFVIQPASNVLVGGYGGFLGQSAGVAGASVNFRSYQYNAAEVHASATDVDPLYGTPLASVPLDVRGVHDVRIDYFPGSLHVYFDGSSTPLLVAAIDLTNFGGASLLDPNGMAFIGFGAGTGGVTDDHRIQSWSFISGPGPGVPYCFGDGSGPACPCANNGFPGHGCENSAATGGARLAAEGTTSPDTLELGSSGELSTAPSIFLQGDASIAPVTFGDGLRCAGGTLKRLFVKVASGGTVAAPDFGAGDPTISQQSANLGDPIAPGSIRYYQVYYRDPDPTFCASPPGDSWNVSNGLRVMW